MILVDTSAWVEFLRATGSKVHHAMTKLIEKDAALATTDIVYMELLAGAKTEARAVELKRLLLRFDHLPVQGLDDYEGAAAIYRSCRRNGETPRQLSDCIVASVAMRADATLLHCDRDFDMISKWTELTVQAV